MKTSTKNAIITGIFSLIAGTMAGYTLNADMQNNKVENMINQSGLVDINNGSSIGDIVSTLLERILEDQTAIKDLSIEITSQKDQNAYLSEQVDELSQTLAELQEENKQLKTAALDNSVTELDYAIQDAEEKRV